MENRSAYAPEPNSHELTLGKGVLYMFGITIGVFLALMGFHYAMQWLFSR